METQIREQTFSLLPQRAMYWHEQHILLLADLHLGKATHFNRNGIPVPSHVFHRDVQRLQSLVEQWKPRSVIILGDLFHSDPNNEFEGFAQWIRSQQQTEFTIIKGNHDRHTEQWCKQTGLHFAEQMVIGDFSLIHEYIPGTETTNYIISGHVHPAVIVSGKARQSLRLPCFYLNEKYMILPAFGNFTGTHALEKAHEADRFYAIAGERVYDTGAAINAG